MDISTLISSSRHIQLSAEESKIPWDEPVFSQRMLANHLSQDHDWASRRQGIIEQQVEWIASQLSPGAHILDLGCGPGFYTQRLAERGFHCTGVDFSPASVNWARQQAQNAGLNIDYVQQDIRAYWPDKSFDFIMITFGELNVFSAADAQALISRCALWLQPGGRLLAEVHTFDEVKRQGMTEASWQRCPDGLFLDVPHLLLTEHDWDEEAQISSTQFWAIEANGQTTRFGSQMTAWRDDEYISLLGNVGFILLPPPESYDWPVSETFEGKLFVVLAEKANTSEEHPLNTQRNKRTSTLDIPRIFTISESEHRIHNPFTEEKYATLGRVLRMKPETRILDLGSGSGEMLCTWADEQAIREIYLRPFEISAKVGGCKAVMSSWNYIGNQWTGACNALLNGVLRGEWGFRGMVITDGFHFTDYMDSDIAIRNGCDLMLKNYDVATNHLTDTTSATSVKAMRQACKNIMYTVVNSRVYDPANTVSTPIWRTAMIVVDVLLAVLLVVLEVLTFKSYKKKKAQ